MEDDAYRALAAREGVHWFHRGRRALVERTIAEVRPGPVDRVLEIGSGTGGNVELLSHFGDVTFIEPNETARHLAQDRFGGSIDLRAGDWPAPDVLAGDEMFDLVALFDVLEHLEHDVEALTALHPHLTSAARVILTVPAYQWMWSAHDERLHHRRRYRKSSLLEVISDAGFRPEYCSYFNTIMFPAAAAARLASRLTPSQQSPGHDVPPAWLNSLMFRTLLLERAVVGRHSLPFGLSLIAVATSAS